MKRLGSVVSAIVIAALIFAIPAAAFAAGTTHDMKGEVVSVDAKAKTITFKDEKARDTYLNHADHKAFATMLGPVMEDVIVLDYWSQE